METEKKQEQKLTIAKECESVRPFGEAGTKHARLSTCFIQFKYHPH